MKAVRVKEPRSIEIVDIPVPAAGPGEVRIRVRVAGITASEKHIFYGSGASQALPYPFVIGRNIAGEVAALGSQVEGIRLGDHVVVDPILGCGFCEPCLGGRPNICTDLRILGVHLPGGMAEYVSVPARNVYVVPSEWSWERAAMVEPFSVAAHVLTRTACTEGEKVLILGASSVGISVMMAARALGAAVAVADVLEARLAAAREFGADFTVNINDDDFERKISDWTGCRGFSVGIDVISLEECFPTLLKLAAPGGRIAVMSFSEKNLALMPAEITRKELSILGSRLNCGTYPKVLEWFASGRLIPEVLVSHNFDYAEAREAFMLIGESPVNTSKVLLHF